MASTLDDTRRKKLLASAGVVIPEVVFELLFEKTRTEGRQDHQCGVFTARLALATIDQIPADALPARTLAELHVRAFAWLGNAHRLVCDFAVADEASRYRSACHETQQTRMALRMAEIERAHGDLIASCSTLEGITRCIDLSADAYLATTAWVNLTYCYLELWSEVVYGRKRRWRILNQLNNSIHPQRRGDTPCPRVP